MKLLRTKTQRLCAKFLILSGLLGCTSAPKSTKFDADWTFHKGPNGEIRSCLSVEDVKKLRELLIRCEQKGE